MYIFAYSSASSIGLRRPLTVLAPLVTAADIRRKKIRHITANQNVVAYVYLDLGYLLQFNTLT